MGQQEVLNILRSDERFWSAKEISRLLEIRERLVRRNLSSLSKMPGIIVQYEDVKFGFRKSYKYNNEEKKNDEKRRKE